MSYRDIVPYTSVFIDANWGDFIKSAWWCTTSFDDDETKIINDLEKLFTNDRNRNSVIPCLSVRTGLDLFLRTCRFFPASEIIMSAINIPAMAEIVRAHGLEVVSLDVDISTMKPKLDLLKSLITSKTKALILANIYGRGYNMDPYIEIAKEYNLYVIEDWAEGFSGLNYFGNPNSDLCLFSFGPIKYYTAFGGAIAKVRDENIYHRMKNMYETYPRQSHKDYLSRILKYSLVYVFLNCPRFVKPGMFMARKLGIDHKKKVIGLLRGFPNQMLTRIRQRPCLALLKTLLTRLSLFDYDDFNLSTVKAEYALSKMPCNVELVGMKADVRNHWLFPVLVDDPDETIKILNKLGVDAYKGATQLNVISTDRKSGIYHPGGVSAWSYKQLIDKQDKKLSTCYQNCNVPHDNLIITNHNSHNDVMILHPQNLTFQFLSEQERGKELTCDEAIKENDTEAEKIIDVPNSEAQYMIDHVIYLPINKTIPFHEIDKIIVALTQAVATSKNSQSFSSNFSFGNTFMCSDCYDNNFDSVSNVFECADIVKLKYQPIKSKL